MLKLLGERKLMDSNFTFVQIRMKTAYDIILNEHIIEYHLLRFTLFKIVFAGKFQFFVI